MSVNDLLMKNIIKEKTKIFSPSYSIVYRKTDTYSTNTEGTVCLLDFIKEKLVLARQEKNNILGKTRSVLKKTSAS